MFIEQLKKGFFETAQVTCTFQHAYKERSLQRNSFLFMIEFRNLRKISFWPPRGATADFAHEKRCVLHTTPSQTFACCATSSDAILECLAVSCFEQVTYSQGRCQKKRKREILAACFERHVFIQRVFNKSFQK